MNKLLAPFILFIFLLIGWFMFGCSQYKIRGSVGYQGQYGNYSVSSDGKEITYDVELKDPNRGFSK